MMKRFTGQADFNRRIFPLRADECQLCASNHGASGIYHANDTISYIFHLQNDALK